jgi:hypothetical protein
MIIESKYRTANTSSVTGILACVMFDLCSMSKHAIEAFTDALSK